MQLVEQHVIERNDPRYAMIDEAAFKQLIRAAASINSAERAQRAARKKKKK